MKLNQTLSLIILFVITTLLSCQKDEIKTDPIINIQFDHKVGNANLEFDTIMYTNSSNNNYSIYTLQYFLSDFEFTKTDGTKILFDTIVYIDAKEEIGLVLAGLILPIGEYSKLDLTFGLDDEKNINGLFVNPPETNMEWPVPMGGGYHYMKLEGKFDSASIVKNYQAHTGRLMTTPHFIDINLEFTNSLNLSSGAEITLSLVMDINNWWESPNNLNLNIMSSVMGNETIQNDLMENGVDAFYIDKIR